MDSFTQKQELLEQLFAQAGSPQEKYDCIISLGREQPHIDMSTLPDRSLVQGCQSRTYVLVQYEKPACRIQIVSDALISAGLGQLLTRVYSGESLEVIVTREPTYLSTLGIFNMISSSRAQGIMSMLTHMRVLALIEASKDESTL